MSGSCWTPEAVDAACRRAYPDYGYSLLRDREMQYAMRAALAAAEPFLREALAREVEAMAEFESVAPGALRAAAARLRAGVPAPEPTKGNT